MLLSWDDLDSKTLTEPPFFIWPYIPERSIVLLWGKTSSGKSPLSWSWARAIGSGEEWFGLPTRKGKVLYIEMDTPEVVAVPRIQKLESAPNVWFLFTQPLSLPHPPPEEQLKELREAAALEPDVVFINTLRKVHDLDDKDSRAPKVVYSWFQSFFPLSSLIFIHHPKKVPSNPDHGGPDDETFSGSMAWSNDAQVGLRLEPHGKDLRLWLHKSQASPKVRPLPLRLAEGVYLSSPLYDEMAQVQTILERMASAPASLRDAEIAKALACSPATAKRRRLLIEAALFPGRWLEIDET